MRGVHIVILASVLTHHSPLLPRPIGQPILVALPSASPLILATSHTCASASLVQHGHLSQGYAAGLLPPPPPSPTDPTSNLFPTWKSRDLLKMVAGSYYSAHNPAKSPLTTGRKSQRHCSDLQALCDLMSPTSPLLLLRCSLPASNPPLRAFALAAPLSPAGCLAHPSLQSGPCSMSPLQGGLPCHPDPPYPIAWISLLLSAHLLFMLFVYLNLSPCAGL